MNWECKLWEVTGDGAGLFQRFSVVEVMDGWRDNVGLSSTIERNEKGSIRDTINPSHPNNITGYFLVKFHAACINLSMINNRKKKWCCI